MGLDIREERGEERMWERREEREERVERRGDNRIGEEMRSFHVPTCPTYLRSPVSSGPSSIVTCLPWLSMRASQVVDRYLDT
jgi:hypothetical protein